MSAEDRPPHLCGENPLKRPQLHPKPSPTEPASMEAHKNALVQDMLAKVRPFVDARGIIKLGDAGGECKTIPDGFIVLLESEKAMVPRILLTTILMNPGNREAGWTAMARSKPLLANLDGWFKEAVSEYVKTAKDRDSSSGNAVKQPLLLVKLLELLALLPLDLETLLSCKFGKSLKRLVNSEEEGNDSIISKATALFARWSAMADQHDSDREDHQEREEQQSNNITSTSSNTNTNKPSTLIEAIPVGRAVQSSNTVNPVLLPSSSGPAIVARPMSADEIQREKKRRAYLESIGVALPGNNNNTTTMNEPAFTAYEEREIPGLSTMQTGEPEEVAVKRAKVSRRVGFPEDPDKLVQIKIFQRDSDELPSAATTGHSASYAAQGLNEASYAFDKLRDDMAEEVEWRTPTLLSNCQTNTANTVFARQQEERERTALSISYHSKDMIPPTPDERVLSSGQSGGPTKNIPIRDPTGSAPIVRHLRTAGADFDSRVPVTPELLSSLLQNISSVVANTAATGNNDFDVGMAGADIPPPPPPPRPIQPQSKGKSGRARPMCKFYREGVSGSCRSGNSCPFRHGAG